MKNTKSSTRFKSFKDLRALLESKALPPRCLPRRNQMPVRDKEVASDPESESRLFQEAMDGVVPIRHNQFTNLAPPPNQTNGAQRQEADSDTLNRLHNLVNNGEGFVVSDTPEYREVSDTMFIRGSRSTCMADNFQSRRILICTDLQPSKPWKIWKFFSKKL